MEIVKLIQQEIQLQDALENTKATGYFHHKVVAYRAQLLRTRRAIHHHYHPRYTVAPLVWEYRGKAGFMGYEYWEARTIFGTITIQKDFKYDKFVFLGFGAVTGSTDYIFSTLKEAKDHAWQRYQTALLPVLQPQPFDEQSAPLLTIADHLHNAAHLGFEWATEALASVEPARYTLPARSLRMALVGAFWWKDLARWAAALGECPVDWAKGFQIDVSRVPQRTIEAIGQQFPSALKTKNPDTHKVVALTLENWELVPVLEKHPALQFKIKISE